MWPAVYEKLVQYASSGDFASKLSVARDSYLKATGELFESDTNFERRMAAFLEWYTLERQLDDGRTPLELFARAHDTALSVAELQAVRTLQRSEQSLFELSLITDDRIDLVDRLCGRTVVLRERGQMMGLSRGDLIVGRIIDDGEQPQLTEGTTFLPRAARKAALAVASELVERRAPWRERQALLMGLTYRANRAERYRHVDASMIFADIDTVVAGPWA